MYRRAEEESMRRPKDDDDLASQTRAVLDSARNRRNGRGLLEASEP